MTPGETRTIVQIRVAQIAVRAGRRSLDQGHVANLAVSVRESGLRHPISVRRLLEDDPRRPQLIYDLISGGHRVEAHHVLGRKIIDAVIDDDDDIAAQLAEVDENLIRRNLDALEWPQAIASRLEAFAARYPDLVVVDEAGEPKAKRGRPKKYDNLSQFSVPTMGFSLDTAHKAGISRKSVERALAVYRGIPAGLQALISGTPLAANAALLSQLAGVADRGEQAKVAELLLKGAVRNVSDARAIAAGGAPKAKVQTPTDEALKAFRALWGKASPGAQAAILNDLAGRKLRGGFKVIREVGDE